MLKRRKCQYSEHLEHETLVDPDRESSSFFAGTFVKGSFNVFLCLAASSVILFEVLQRRLKVAREDRVPGYNTQSAARNKQRKKPT